MATTIGEAVVKLTFDGKDVKASLNKVSSDIESSGKSSGSMWANAWSVAAGSLISKAVTKIGSVITQNLGRAINRADTLNNFPKVMTNLGIAAEDSSVVIRNLSEKIIGLPTALDDAAAAVQRFTSKNNDVKKSEQIFLAVNNAILAGGASADIQSSALEQLSQAYAKGKPDMMEWRTLQMAMPAQLNQISQAMLGNTTALDSYIKKAEEYSSRNPMSSTGKELLEQLQAVKNGSGDMATALGTALRTGVISMDDFTNTMIQMNQVGIDGFPNLEQQARNATGGIGTAIENVKNRIAAAMQKIIDSIGVENISNAINTISSGFTKVADVVINVINFLQANTWVLDTILAFFGSLLALGIASKVASFIQMISTFVTANPILVAIMAIITVITLVLTHLDEISAWINENLPWLPPVIEKIGEVLGKIGEFIGKVIAKCAELWEYIKPVFERLFELWKFLWENIVQPIIGKIFETIGKRVNELFTVVKFVFETVFNIFKTFFTVAVGIIEGVASFFTGLWDGIKTGVEGAINVVRTVFDNVKNWINDHIVSPIKGFFEGLWNGIKDGAKGVKDFISNIFGTIGNIVKTPINGIIGGINGVLGKINSIKIPDWVPVIGGAHTNFGMIPTLAQGGYADNSTQAIIGEAGKEVVLPLEANTDNWSGLLAETLLEKMSEQDEGDYNGQPLVVNLNLDGSVVEQVLLNKIRRAV